MRVFSARRAGVGAASTTPQPTATVTRAAAKSFMPGRPSAPSEGHSAPKLPSQRRVTGPKPLVCLCGVCNVCYTAWPSFVRPSPALPHPSSLVCPAREAGVSMHLVLRPRPALLAATVLLANTASFAGFQQPGAIPAERVEATSPNASARFTCELRPFDLSRGLFCYGPAAMRAAYKTDTLINAGNDGTGQTIVILDAFGSPTAKADLDAFDATFGVPAPPSFRVVTMPGTPAFNPNDNNMLGWAE